MTCLPPASPPTPTSPPASLAHARGIDETIVAVPGLEGLTLVADYVAAARRRFERAGMDGNGAHPRS